MAWRVDIKSAVLGGVCGAALCVLVGAAADELPGPVGRFQIDCTQNGAYVVDTITGQVWSNAERTFRNPKLGHDSTIKGASPTESVPSSASPAPVRQPRPTRSPAAAASGFTGKWVLTHPTEGQLGIQIEPDGRAILTEGNKTWEGKWRVEGNQIMIATEGESVTAQLDDQGRLQVREGSSDPIAFQRAE